MKRFLLGLFVLTGCGPASSGPVPDATYFWQLVSSTVEFGQCSDSENFRTGIEPITIGTNSFLVYRISSDGKTAVSQTCAELDSSTCSDDREGLVYSVAGSELSASAQDKGPFGEDGCMLQETQTWTLVDKTKTIEVSMASVLSLVDSTDACETIEANARAQSPNMLGINGCVITFKLVGELR